MPRVSFCLAAAHPAAALGGGERAVEVPAGTSVLDAAAQIGALVPTQCGGVLACLACRVRVRGGQVRPAGSKERARLDEVGAASDERFACHTKVLGDVLVELPPPNPGDRA